MVAEAKRRGWMGRREGWAGRGKGGGEVGGEALSSALTRLSSSFLDWGWARRMVAVWDRV